MLALERGYTLVAKALIEDETVLGGIGPRRLDLPTEAFAAPAQASRSAHRNTRTALPRCALVLDLAIAVDIAVLAERSASS